MKPTATPLLLTALLFAHAYAAELPAAAVADIKSQLRAPLGDALDASIVPDAVVLGSVRSKNRLVAVSTPDDDTAVMTTNAKTTSRAQESLLGAVPTRGASAARAANTLVARSGATDDAATMTTTSATVVRAEDPSV